MQEKRTLYLAGKITGDPYYFTKFYNAQKKLEEGGSGTASGGGRESGRSRSMLARRARAISRALHRA